MISLSNIDRSFTTRPAATPVVVPVSGPSSAPLYRRERDFGVGYGRSSGYASDRQYAKAWGQQLFRCA